MAFRKTLRVFLPSNQIVNLQMLYHPCLKVFVNQLSQKQTLSIRSMHKLCLGKKFSWLRHCMCVCGGYACAWLTWDINYLLNDCSSCCYYCNLYDITVFLIKNL